MIFSKTGGHARRQRDQECVAAHVLANELHRFDEFFQKLAHWHIDHLFDRMLGKMFLWRKPPTLS
jgi:hypothetical protein